MSYDLGQLARTLFEESGNALFFKDTDLRVVAANQRYCEALGRPEADILGKTDRDLFPQALGELRQRSDRQVLIEQRMLRAEEWLDYPDGKRSK